MFVHLKQMTVLPSLNVYLGKLTFEKIILILCLGDIQGDPHMSNKTDTTYKAIVYHFLPIVQYQ
jgi:hypothetical protein